MRDFPMPENPAMHTDLARPQLGGLSPAQFMRRHWQKRPLVVRQAFPGIGPLLPRSALFELAAREGVESRLVRRMGDRWTLRRGPLPRRALPPLKANDWTLLVQGLDLHLPAAHAMLAAFDFVPHARLDDLMVSWASDGGGVGPHVDAYDVFLVQLDGRRRWRVAPPGDRRFIEDLPLRILQHFEPTEAWVLEPGDMLYLPPLWGHDGIAEGGDCMTCSIGFRAPEADALAQELLQRLGDEEVQPSRRYRDPPTSATPTPAAVPTALRDFARTALERRLADPHWLPRALGEWLTEPKPQVWFPTPDSTPKLAGRPLPSLHLVARTRMMYDDRFVFINGEALEAAGRDATLMHQLADTRCLPGAAVARLSSAAREMVEQWLRDGWVAGEFP
jgi:50S ribosomal protein L16 3-hydroxylase